MIWVADVSGVAIMFPIYWRRERFFAAQAVGGVKLIAAAQNDISSRL
jgi:hypothetical protein